MKGFSPACVIWCATRCDLLSKPHLHTVHTRVFSPVCLLWYKGNADSWLTPCGRFLQIKRFCLECAFMCESSCVLRLKSCPTSTQPNAPHLEFSIPFNTFPLSIRFSLWIWLGSIFAILFLPLKLTSYHGGRLENTLEVCLSLLKGHLELSFSCLLAVSLKQL